MPRNIIHVVGTGTIGEPLIGILSDFKQKLGIDEVTFHKNTPLTTDRSKVNSLLKRGARLSTKADSFVGFNEINLKPEFTTDEAIERATVVIDCTPSGVGHKNKVQYYEKYKNNTKGFIAQGSESGFGKMYARGINDSSLVKGLDQYIHVVSCNTHNLCCLIDTMVLSGENKNNLKEGMFTCIRRSNDVSQASGFVPSPQVGSHEDSKYGTHHARDAAELYRTLGEDLNLFSSAIKINSQYMHILHFHLRVQKSTNMEELINKLKANDRIALTDKVDSCKVFSFGRDHGHFGRILNQTVISTPSLHISSNGTEITGFCFTPQDGNSLLSSISAALWFIYPNSYEDKIQCLKPLFFQEV